MINDFIKFCKKHRYEYEKGYDWCDCNDYNDFVIVKIKGKWHTLYCLNDGSYRFDKTIVNSIEEIESLLKEWTTN